MARLKSNLHVPYNDLSRFLEHLPAGMSYDILQSKVPSLRALGKKDLELLLEYVIEKNRITVTPTTQKGSASSPYLRHKMHTGPVNVIAQPEAEKPEGEVVRIAGAGKQTLVTRKRTLINRIVPVMDKPVMNTETPVNKIDFLNVNNVNKSLFFTNELRKKHLKDEKLINAAGAVKDYLLQNKDGVTRTQIDRYVSKYRYLKGTDRPEVLNYLKKYEGVKEHNVEGKDKRYSSSIFVHGDFCKPLTTSEQRFDHDAPQLGSKPVNLATLPEMVSPAPALFTPINFKEESQPVASSVDVRKQILELERVAAELEQKERNEALIAAIKPLRDEIVLQFAATQKAIDAQIDAQAALGLAIEQLNKVLGY